MNSKKFDSDLWVEKWRSSSIDGLILPLDIKNQFKKYIAAQTIPNLLFESESGGTGKSTAAFALLNECDYEYKYINGSVDNGINLLRDIIHPFASQMSFEDKKKAIIFDEFDRASPALQDGLKAFIETYSEKCRFIFVTNHLRRIDSRIISRVPPTHFDFTDPVVKAKHLPKITKRVKGILDSENVEYNEDVVERYVAEHYPDMRYVINSLQTYNDRFGSISEVIFSDMNVDHEFFNLILASKLTSARKFAMERNFDFTSIYSTMKEQFLPLVPKEIAGELLCILQEYQYQSNFSYDKELCLAAALYKIIYFINDYRSEK